MTDIKVVCSSNSSSSSSSSSNFDMVLDLDWKRRKAVTQRRGNTSQQE